MPFELIAEDSIDAGDATSNLAGVEASTERLEVCEGDVADRKAEAMLEAVPGG